MKLAEQNKISSIAFPAISTGAFGYPFEEATLITYNTILNEIGGLKHLQKIKFVLHGEHDFIVYSEFLADLNDD